VADNGSRPDEADGPPATVPGGGPRAAGIGPVPPAVVVLVGMAAAIAVLGGLRAAASIVAPIVLAFVIAVGVYPVQQALDRHMPRWVAAVITMVVTYLGISLLVLALTISAVQFGEILPNYRDQADQMTQDTLSYVQGFGVSDDDLAQALAGVDAGSVLGLVSVLIEALAETFGSLLFVLVLLFFLLVDASTMPQRMTEVAGRAPGVARSLQDLTSGIRRFLVVTTVFGAIVAVIDVGILVAFGVPLPLLWGLLSFITNYIPNIGLVVGLIPPALFALLDGGPVVAFWVTVLWLLANFVVQTLIQPKIVGDEVGLSVTATVVSVFVWGWVLGALGALLAVPLSLAAKELLFDEHSPRGWVSPLVSSWNMRGRRPDPGVAHPQPARGEPAGTGPAPGTGEAPPAGSGSADPDPEPVSRP
jgi:predicted PurR-regulated permease PerM